MVLTFPASPSLMELQVHSSIYGHLSLQPMKLILAVLLLTFVLAQTLILNGRMHQIPSFVGNNYFCDTGNRGPNPTAFTTYPDDPLWDGEGCGPTSSCCQLNNPPWFCTTLPQPTTDDLEVRVCGVQSRTNEDSLTTLVDISVM